MEGRVWCPTALAGLSERCALPEWTYRPNSRITALSGYMVAYVTSSCNGTRLGVHKIRIFHRVMISASRRGHAQKSIKVKAVVPDMFQNASDSACHVRVSCRVSCLNKPVCHGCVPKLGAGGQLVTSLTTQPRPYQYACTLDARRSRHHPVARLSGMRACSCLEWL